MKAKSVLFVTFFLFLSTLNYNQTNRFSITEIDSLYAKILQVTSPELLSDKNNHPLLTTADKKCGFELINNIKINIEQFHDKQQSVLQKILTRPVKQTSIVSPSEFFRIHYDTTGSSIPDYIDTLTIEENVMQVANAIDSSFNYEVGFLGYPPPISDNGAGGDNKYDIYIVNQPSGLYGYTEIEQKVGPTNWTSFIVIDNDYSGYFSPGLNGLLVTVAHELHHGIQLGNYGVLNNSLPYRIEDVFFYEITSTSMEEFVYDEVNDYYAYMSTYFQNPAQAFPQQNGYNLCIWNLYLKEIFNHNIIKDQWEMIPNSEAIMCIENSLIQNNSSFGNELNNFGVWTYFTNFRAIPGLYFEEASSYPLISLTSTIQFNPPSTILNHISHPTANNYYKINLPSGEGFFTVIVSNGDAERANQNPNQSFPFTYSLYNYFQPGSELITGNFYFTFESPFEEEFNIKHIFNDVANIRINNFVQHYNLLQNYPNPFNPSTKIKFTIPALLADRSDFGFVNLKIYDLLGREIATLVNEESAIGGAGEYEVEFNSSALPSGIYFYQLRAGQYIETKKMVLIK